MLMALAFAAGYANASHDQACFLRGFLGKFVGIPPWLYNLAVFVPLLGQTA